MTGSQKRHGRLRRTSLGGERGQRRVGAQWVPEVVAGIEAMTTAAIQNEDRKAVPDKGEE